jgi:transcriptional regulator with XRE-family HTH domain
MVIGERLRKLRKSKNLSQGDIETRTGMLRAYISRVENGHTIPTIESLEKLAQAFKVPLYKLFYDGKVSASIRTWKRPSSEEWGDREADATYLRHLSKLLARMTPNQRNLLMHVAQKISRRG